MRIAGFFLALGLGLALIAGGWQAAAQTAVQKKETKAAQKKETKAAPAKQKKAKAKKGAKPAPMTAEQKAGHLTALQTYAAMTPAERTAIQSDLAWTGDYNGLIDGEFTDRSVAAVREFQKKLKNKQTGILNPQERAQLAAAAKAPQEEVGWRMVTDETSGTRLGIPSKLAPERGKGKTGGRWFSQQGQIQIEAFRVRERGIALAAVFEREKKEPPQRKVEYSVLRDHFFVVSGLQGLKKFYVRGYIRDGEVRGFTLLYDQATEGTMDAVAVAMSNAFQPFPALPVQSAAPPVRRKVEYGTAIVATREGHLVTDRQNVDGCQSIVVAGHGHAERVVDDEVRGVALVRLYGAANLVPLPLAGEPAQGPNLTLVGISDPQAQGGGAAVTTPSARLTANNAITPAPQPGLAGAVALDAQGRFFGMATTKAAVAAGAAGNAPALTAIVPAEAIGEFLKAHKVAPAAGRADAAAAKAAVVRVICVRK
jgi:hypothetical protein